jgi:hypothetical protein
MLVTAILIFLFLMNLQKIGRQRNNIDITKGLKIQLLGLKIKKRPSLERQIMFCTF